VRLLVFAGAHFPGGCVDAGDDDLDHDLARSGRRIGQVATLMTLRPLNLPNHPSRPA
jgi:hypothetical protein